MSLLGLLRHLAETERDPRNRLSDDEPVPKPYGAKDGDFHGAVAVRAVVDAAYLDPEREQVASRPRPTLRRPSTRIWVSAWDRTGSRFGS
jgi:hypothetical protein